MSKELSNLAPIIEDYMNNDDTISNVFVVTVSTDNLDMTAYSQGWLPEILVECTTKAMKIKVVEVYSLAGKLLQEKLGTDDPVEALKILNELREKENDDKNI